MSKGQSTQNPEVEKFIIQRTQNSVAENFSDSVVFSPRLAALLSEKP